MKNIIISGIAVLMMFLGVSCTGILKEDPPSAVSLSNFYLSKKDAESGLYGAYYSLYSISGASALDYGELNADDLTISPLVSDGYSWDYFTYNSDVTGPLWQSCFEGINRTNEVIQYTPKINMDEQEKSNIVAEAKALRAFCYFQLVRVMGGVPIYQSPTVGFDSMYIPRASEEQVYTLIIQDLKDAASILEPSSAAGRINSNIANALLARVYLYRSDYENALKYARSVIDAGAYDLFNDYADVFKPEKKNGIEHIWQVQYLSGEINNNSPGRFAPRQTPGPYARSFWAQTTVPGSYAPSAQFVSQNPTSYRKSVTISDRYEHIDGVSGTVTMQQVYGGVFPYYIAKFDDRAAELQSGGNFTILRYADILLIAAEALNEVDPNNNEKYAWINKVRTRARKGVSADLPDLSGLSQSEFRTAVLEERRFELAFEGERAWDLKRRNMFLENVRAQGKTVEDYMVLFPVPNVQIALNKNLNQNAGW